MRMTAELLESSTWTESTELMRMTAELLESSTWTESTERVWMAKSRMIAVLLESSASTESTERVWIAKSRIIIVRMRITKCKMVIVRVWIAKGWMPAALLEPRVWTESRAVRSKSFAKLPDSSDQLFPSAVRTTVFLRHDVSAELCLEFLFLIFRQWLDILVRIAMILLLAITTLFFVEFFQ
jgi:hypothetical protein